MFTVQYIRARNVCAVCGGRRLCEFQIGGFDLVKRTAHRRRLAIGRRSRVLSFGKFYYFFLISQREVVHFIFFQVECFHVTQSTLHVRNIHTHTHEIWLVECVCVCDSSNQITHMRALLRIKMMNSHNRRIFLHSPVEKDEMKTNERKMEYWYINWCEQSRCLANW